MLETEKSEYNSALDNLRIWRTLLTFCVDSSINKDYSGYYEYLMALRKELYYFMTQTDKTAVDKYKEELYDKINKIETLNQTGRKYSVPKEIIDKLDQWELLTRKVLHDRGFMQKMKEDFLTPEAEWSDEA